jgi:membrane protease YdiL (CAAX protease family)
MNQDDFLPEHDDQPEPEPQAEEVSPIRYRGATSDPVFGYLIALALAVGLTALPPDQRDLRYTILWLVPAGFGVLAWLLGNSARIQEESPENLAWGVAFALIVATPLLAVGGSVLTTTVNLLFTDMTYGTLLAYLVFVMPLAETLFYRGVLQQDRPFWVVALMSTLWGVLLFFPMLDLSRYPAIAGLIALALLMLNFIYSYVRRRNGLAAAWICQIVVNLVLIFFPFISG